MNKNMETAKELYEKYKGFNVIRGIKLIGTVVGYCDYCVDGSKSRLISTIDQNILDYDYGWKFLADGDFIPDYMGAYEKRKFMYISESDIIK